MRPHNRGGPKSQLDAIDQRAHDEIQKVIDSKGGWFGPLAILCMIWAIITRARGEAIAVTVDAVRAIAQEAARILSADAPTSSDPARKPTTDARRASTRISVWCQAAVETASDCLAVSGANRMAPPPHGHQGGPRFRGHPTPNTTLRLTTPAEREGRQGTVRPKRVCKSPAPPVRQRGASSLPGLSRSKCFDLPGLPRSAASKLKRQPRHHAADQSRLRNVGGKRHAAAGDAVHAEHSEHACDANHAGRSADACNRGQRSVARLHQRPRRRANPLPPSVSRPKPRCPRRGH